MNTCTVDGCGKAHRARGLCATHYNQAHQPNRHRSKTVTCDGCGIDYLKSVSGHKWTTNYCTELCRQWGQYGAWSSKLPATHWARMYGTTSAHDPGRMYTCAWCGTEAHTYNDATRFCCMDHKNKAKRVRRRGRVHNAIGEYTWTDLTRLWLAFDRCCAYCLTPTPLDDIQAEHVVALSCGGANNLSNLLPSCAPCNADKRDLTLTAWATDRERRHLPPVITTWDDTDTRYAHLAAGRTLVRM